jgi:hypothetical protein
MFNKFINIFSLDSKILKKSLQEYIKLKELETKRLSIIEEYKDEVPEEIKTVQRDILRNNLLMLGKTVDLEGGFNNKDLDKNIYFNIQGTKPSVQLTNRYFSKVQLTDKYGKNEVICNGIDEDIFYSYCSEILNLNKKFMNLRSQKIKKRAKTRLRHLAEKKIVSKTIEFCKLFKGNEDLVQEFVFSDLTGENDHWHNFFTFEARLNILAALYPYIKDSEDFRIDRKEVIYIDAYRLRSSLEDFLPRINNKKYDFILLV